MTDRDRVSEEQEQSLELWRQGDFALGVGGFLFAGLADGAEAFDAREQTEGIVGLVAISQTCDIVRRTGGRDYVAVCPLVRVDAAELSAVRKGRRPYLTDIENAEELAFADLRRVMSVDKDLLRTWDRLDGFSTEAGRVRFAAALERKFGQFAFPNKFDQATKSFRDRVWSRHDRAESDPGKVYRSLLQIRFRASPSWDADERTITVIAVLADEGSRETDRKAIGEELENVLAKITWPIGYRWGDPTFILGTASELSAADIVDSRRADFDFLCY